MYDISDKVEYEAFSIGLKAALNPENLANFSSSTTQALPNCLAYTDDIGLVRRKTAYWEFHLPQYDRYVRGGHYLIFKYGDGIEESILDYPDLVDAIRTIRWVDPDDALQWMKHCGIEQLQID